MLHPIRHVRRAIGRTRRLPFASAAKMTSEVHCRLTPPRTVRVSFRFHARYYQMDLREGILLDVAS